MNNFKVGDKVWYDGEVRTVIQVPNEKTINEVGYLHKDYVILDLHYETAIYYKDIELYKSAHEKLIEKGFKWNPIYNHYERPHSVIGTLLERISVYKGIKKIQTNFEYDLDFSKILTQYLEELENVK